MCVIFAIGGGTLRILIDKGTINNNQQSGGNGGTIQPPITDVDWDDKQGGNSGSNGDNYGLGQTKQHLNTILVTLT